MALHRIGLIAGLILLAAGAVLLLQAKFRNTKDPQLVDSQAEKRALLIGVQSYSALDNSWQDLAGSLNDIELTRTMLRDRFGFPEENIRVVSDLEATRDRIVRAVEKLTAETRDGDLVYLHYSGHGSLVTDANGDETDRMDSSLVPIDARNSGSWDILDDEIYIWLDRLLQKAADVVFVVDACHSGTITRGESSLKSRGAPIGDKRDYSWSKSLRTEMDGVNARWASYDRFVRVSASMDRELAEEHLGDDGKIYGALTWHWCKALMSAGPASTYGDVFRRAEALVYQEKKGKQNPRIEGARNLQVFGGSFPPPSRQIVALSTEETGIHFWGGILNGVTAGSLFESAVGHRSSRPPSVVKIVSVGAYDAIGRLLSGEPPEKGSWLRETEHAYPFPPLKVLMRGGGNNQTETIAQVRRKLGVMPEVEFIEKGETPDLILSVDDAGGQPVCRILDNTEALYGNRTLMASLLEVPLPTPAEAWRVGCKINEILRIRTLSGLAAEFIGSEPDVLVELLHLQAPGGEDAGDLISLDVFGRPPQRGVVMSRGDATATACALPDEAVITFRVENRGYEPRYIYFVNLTPYGEIKIMFPVDGNDETRIDPGEAKLILKATRQVADPGWLDTYLCFITDTGTEILDLEGDGLECVDATRSSGSMRGSASWKDVLVRLGRSRTRGGEASMGQAGSFASRVFVVRVTGG